MKLLKTSLANYLRSKVASEEVKNVYIGRVAKLHVNSFIDPWQIRNILTICFVERIAYKFRCCIDLKISLIEVSTKNKNETLEHLLNLSILEMNFDFEQRIREQTYRKLVLFLISDAFPKNNHKNYFLTRLYLELDAVLNHSHLCQLKTNSISQLTKEVLFLLLTDTALGITVKIYKIPIMQWFPLEISTLFFCMTCFPNCILLTTRFSDVWIPAKIEKEFKEVIFILCCTLMLRLLYCLDLKAYKKRFDILYNATYAIFTNFDSYHKRSDPLKFLYIYNISIVPILNSHEMNIALPRF